MCRAINLRECTAERSHSQADNYRAEVPLHVEVFGFTMPDRMTCQTAFGFDTSEVWRYHGVKTDEHRRQVLDKYFQCLADHHISPYNPAPLDPIHVTWENMPPWSGGETRCRQCRTRAVPPCGWRTNRERPMSRRSTSRRSPSHDQGVRLSFWYRTHQPGHRFLVTISHHDAGGRWMSGRNNDLLVEGDAHVAALRADGGHSSRPVREFHGDACGPPSGARTAALTGTVWFDDVSLIDVASGAERVTGGDFESSEQPAPEPVFDFTAWDRAMQRAIDVYHFNTFQLDVPGLGGGTFHERYEPELLGYAEHTPQYEGAMQAYLQTLQTHLREQGWLDEAFVYWFDEPDPKDYAFVNNGFAKLKKWAPDIRRMLTEQVEEALVGGPNIWCPLTPSYDDQVAAQRRDDGDTFWWYVCTGPKAPYCTLFIDHPGTELRVWLWQTWQRNIAGMLVWQTNYWTSSAAYPDPAQPQNPYADPMGWVSGYSTPAGRASGVGQRRRAVSVSARVGRRRPPDRTRCWTAPWLPSGWRCCATASRTTNTWRCCGSMVDAQRATLTAEQLAEYTALLEVPAAITSDLTTFTRDPAPIEQRREENRPWRLSDCTQVGRARFDRPPLLDHAGGRGMFGRRAHVRLSRRSHSWHGHFGGTTHVYAMHAPAVSRVQCAERDGAGVQSHGGRRRCAECTADVDGQGPDLRRDCGQAGRSQLGTLGSGSHGRQGRLAEAEKNLGNVEFVIGQASTAEEMAQLLEKAGPDCAGAGGEHGHLRAKPHHADDLRGGPAGRRVSSCR